MGGCWFTQKKVTVLPMRRLIMEALVFTLMKTMTGPLINELLLSNDFYPCLSRWQHAEYGDVPLAFHA